MLSKIKPRPLIKGVLRSIANPKLKMNHMDCLDLESQLTEEEILVCF